MKEEQRDIICKLAWLVFRIESRKTSQEQRDAFNQELNDQVRKLNSICNPHLMMIPRVDGSEKDSYHISTSSTVTAGNERRVVFREVKRDQLVTYWYVEVYSEEGNQFPVGTAYVKSIEERGFAQLDFILVADQWRRQGFGARLCEAIRERWPGVVATGAMDEAGAGLLATVGWNFDGEESDNHA